MAELTVSTPYDPAEVTTARNTLKLTFPVWGIACPITFAIGTIIAVPFVFSDKLLAGLFTEQAMPFLGLYFSSFALFLGGLVSTKLLNENRLIVDRFGIHLPICSSTWRSQRFLSWTTLKSIAVHGGSQNWRQAQLTVTPNRGRAIKLPLAPLSEKELEQLLLATEMWCPQIARSDTLAQTKNLLQIQTGSKQIASFTQMWEDELRRRFGATAFLPLEPGQRVRDGKLQIVRHLAFGGLSAIYLGQLEDNRLVVLKEAVVPEDAPVHAQTKALEMFEREAKLLMKLEHPGIVKVQDYFVENGRSYMLLDYVNGQDLRQYIQQNGPQKESVVLEWSLQIATILKHLHEQDPPIIHRDLTPDNLVVQEDGHIVLIDFGAANEFIGQATGTFVGKQCFIAPEQFRGKAVVQSDIYSFGCTMHFLLTGQEPEALEQSSPRAAGATLSDELEEVVTACTQMEVRDRYQSASHLIPVLRRIAATLTRV